MMRVDRNASMPRRSHLTLASLVVVAILAAASSEQPADSGAASSPSDMTSAIDPTTTSVDASASPPGSVTPTEDIETIDGMFDVGGHSLYLR
jgi:hypothetical protein